MKRKTDPDTKKYLTTKRNNLRRKLKEAGEEIPDELKPKRPWEDTDTFCDVRRACERWLRSRGLEA